MEKLSKHLKNWKYTNSMKMANNKIFGISNVLLFLNFLYLDLGKKATHVYHIKLSMLAILRTVPTNSKVFLPRFMIIQEM